MIFNYQTYGNSMPTFHPAPVEPKILPIEQKPVVQPQINIPNSEEISKVNRKKPIISALNLNSIKN